MSLDAANKWCYDLLKRATIIKEGVCRFSVRNVKGEKKMKKRITSLVVCAAFLSLSTHAWACRPLFTDDCPPTDQGHFGIETGLLSSNQSGFDQNLQEMTSIKYGLFERADIGIDLPYQSITPSGGSNASGLADVNVKSKIGIIPLNDNNLGVSVGLNAKLANGDSAKGLGSGAVDYSINTIFTKTLPNSLVHLNLGYTFTGQPSGQSLNNVISCGLAGQYNLRDSFRVLGEVFGSTPSDPASNLDLAAAQIGFNWDFNPNLTLDAGYTVGLSDASPKNMITAGLTASI